MGTKEWGTEAKLEVPEVRREHYNPNEILIP